MAAVVRDRIEAQRKVAESGSGVRKPSPPTTPSDLLPSSHPEFKMRYKNAAGASIVHTPYQIDYFKTRGRVSPFFDGLGEGKCLATYCPDHGVFMAPVSTCRHCLDDISENWTDLAKVVGKIQTWTSMSYTGPSFKGDLPFHNVLVEFPGDHGLVDAVTGEKLANQTVTTSVMSRLVLPDWMTQKDIYAGMPVRAQFNTRNPTGRATDMWYAPAFGRDEWEFTIKRSVTEQQKASNSNFFTRDVPTQYM